MVPSALRTMSVVTLLSAVSGSVFLLNDHPGAADRSSVEPAAADTAAINSSAGGFAASNATVGFGPGRRNDAARAGLAGMQIPSQRVGALVDREQMQFETAIRRAEHREVMLVAAAEQRAKELAQKQAEEKAAKAKAAATARAKTKAATERRRERAAAQVSRSAQRDPRAVARALAADRGWGSGQFSCLNSLWIRESGWNYRATNPSSGAYGIPQSLPASKMASAGADYRTNPVTQIRWGLSYIDERYGTPCAAWAHSESTGWY